MFQAPQAGQPGFDPNADVWAQQARFGRPQPAPMQSYGEGASQLIGQLGGQMPGGIMQGMPGGGMQAGNGQPMPGGIMQGMPGGGYQSGPVFSGQGGGMQAFSGQPAPGGIMQGMPMPGQMPTGSGGGFAPPPMSMPGQIPGGGMETSPAGGMNRPPMPAPGPNMNRPPMPGRGGPMANPGQAWAEADPQMKAQMSGAAGLSPASIGSFMQKKYPVPQGPSQGAPPAFSPDKQPALAGGPQIQGGPIRQKPMLSDPRSGGKPPQGGVRPPAPSGGPVAKPVKPMAAPPVSPDGAPQSDDQKRVASEKNASIMRDRAKKRKPKGKYATRGKYGNAVISETTQEVS